jgi:methylenetetrahydrofolate reductase (NADPH)
MMTRLQSGLDHKATRPHVAALLRGFSLEATLPAQAELDELGSVLPPSAPIYLSAPPGHPPARLLQAAKQVRQAGFEPVPHVAARNYRDRDALSDFIAGICGEAGTRRVLVIAGDVDRPAGPFIGANDIIESDLLQRHGIRDVGISGYPDGHPKLSEGLLDRAMRAKLVSAEERGLKLHIVSQFCFDSDRIVAWLRSLRTSGIRVPCAHLSRRCSPARQLSCSEMSRLTTSSNVSARRMMPRSWKMCPCISIRSGACSAPRAG